MSTTDFLLMLYVIPMGFCQGVFAFDAHMEFISDRKNRIASGASYSPKLTVGRIILRVIVSLIPLINIWAVVWGFAPKLAALYTERFFDLSIDYIIRFCDLMELPLVPDSETHKKQRSE